MEVVKAMKNLGVMLGVDGTMDEEVEHRIGAGTRTNRKLLGNMGLSRKTKVKVYNACIVPTLLYGCESWTLQAGHMSQVQAVETKYLRRVAGITWMDEVSNAKVREG